MAKKSVPSDSAVQLFSFDHVFKFGFLYDLSLPFYQNILDPI